MAGQNSTALRQCQLALPDPPCILALAAAANPTRRRDNLRLTWKLRENYINHPQIDWRDSNPEEAENEAKQEKG